MNASYPLPTAAGPAQEAGLVARARRGEEAAFVAIMRHNNQRLFRIARSILKDEAEAEEVVQETYLTAFTHLEGLVEVTCLSAWLARVATNQALMCLRRRQPTTELNEVSDQEIALEPIGGAAPDSPEAAAARSEIRGLLESAIDDLPLDFRTVFVLRALEEMSVAETADCLGLRQETVKTRFHRAKRGLRRSLSAQLQATLVEAFPFAGRRCDRIVAAVCQRLGLSQQA
ncbi:MAG: RNA polymerase sigma factor [Pseudomonadota bacterium]